MRHLLLAASCALLAPAAGIAGTTPAEPAASVVQVTRVRPQRPKLPTLRFLTANRDYLRGEMDRLHARVVRVAGDGGALDPRFLAYGRMVAEAGAAGDSAAAADSARAGRTLYASVTELGELESELDQMDRALASQRDRLGALQRDFAGDQRTELAVVLSGWPQGLEPSRVTLLLEDGTQDSVSLDDAQRAALRSGGAVQVMHRMLEPRTQVLGVALAGATAPGWLELDPQRDRLNLLRLDLSALGGDDPARLVATTWVLDDRTP
jgi:hypothetical protein